MSRGNDLQEMEVGTAQSKSAVNAGAKPAEGMPGAGTNASGVTTPGQRLFLRRSRWSITR